MGIIILQCDESSHFSHYPHIKSPYDPHKNPHWLRSIPPRWTIIPHSLPLRPRGTFLESNGFVLLVPIEMAKKQVGKKILSEKFEMAWTWTSLRSCFPRSSAFLPLLWLGSLKLKRHLMSFSINIHGRLCVEALLIHVGSMSQLSWTLFRCFLQISQLPPSAPAPCGVLDEGSDRAKRWIHEP